MSGLLKRFPLYLLIGILFLGSFLLIWGRAMQRGYNRDENQFVASGELLAAQTLLPYRDYPYFHMPNLIFLYALVDKVTDYSLLGARAVSVVFSIVNIILIFLICHNFFRGQKLSIRITAIAGGVILLLANPIYAYTSGLAWNHDLPVLLILLAFIVHVHGTKRENPALWTLISGGLIGLAIGTRLTFILVAIPFIVTLFYFPGIITQKERLKIGLAFCLGMILGLTPSLSLFTIAPREFIFGNITYAQLNTAFREETGFIGPMGLVEKMEHLRTKVLNQPGNLLLFLAMIFFAYTTGIVEYRQKRQATVESLLILLIIPFLGIGALLPTPTFNQYYFSLVPFAIVGILYGLARFNELSGQRNTWPLVLFLQVVVLSSVYFIDDAPNIARLGNPRSWYPLQVHRLGKEIQAASTEAKVLTLTPIYPLDGGAEIYAEFATGVFAWRTGHLLTVDQRQAYQVISEEELDDFLRKDPPGAILVGLHPGQEGPLIDYARQEGFKESLLSEDLTLWVR